MLVFELAGFFLKFITMWVQFGLHFRCSGSSHSRGGQQGLADFVVEAVMFSQKINLVYM